MGLLDVTKRATADLTALFQADAELIKKEILEELAEEEGFITENDVIREDGPDWEDHWKDQPKDDEEEDDLEEDEEML